MTGSTHKSAEQKDRSADSNRVDSGEMWIAEGLRSLVGDLWRQWRFFLAACLLTGALLLPHAPVASVVTGMALAGLVQVGWTWFSGRRDRR